MGRPAKNKNSYYFQQKNKKNNVENVENKGVFDDTFLNTENFSFENVENPIFETPKEEEEDEEKKEKINNFKIPEFQHPYLFGLEIANTLINKYFKKNIYFSESEKKELSQKMWIAFPNIPEISPKIDLFLSLGLLYANKLNII